MTKIDTQPEALRLAAGLEEGCCSLRDWLGPAATELRRLHAENAAQAQQIAQDRADAARAATGANNESLASIVFALARLSTWHPSEAILHQIDRLADYFEGEKIGTNFRLLARDARNPKRHPPMSRLVFSGGSTDAARAAAMKEKTP